MKMMLDIDIKSPDKRISYNDKILLIGSCFTEHIGNRLEELKFSILQNPNGILFDPLSVSKSIVSYIGNTVYKDEDLFYLNELWQSWNHHSIFSGTKPEEVMAKINESQKKAHEFITTADWLMITLGSSFSYQLSENGNPVANCHRAPAKWFNKQLLRIDETVSNLDNMIHQLFHLNKKINVIFTVSPVRHIRDGVIENNRSKARLLEAVHHLVNKFERLYYFPAYELVIDVLRDYRFYDVDLVHPNYAATEFVFENFRQFFITEETVQIMDEVKRLMTAYRHKPFQPSTEAHRQFLKGNLERIQQFQQKNPHLDFSKEIKYFSSPA
jgi:GSCFA family protein